MATLLCIQNYPKNNSKVELFCKCLYNHASLVLVLKMNVDGVILSNGKFTGVKKFIQHSNLNLSEIKASATNVNHTA